MSEDLYYVNGMTRFSQLNHSDSLSAASSGNKVVKFQQPPNYEPNNYSVICGRGKECYNAIGNARFRVIVDIYLDRYDLSKTKLDKSLIVRQVVSMVRSAGGDFVRFHNNRWWEVGDSAAREKVGALFRDLLHEKYRSSAKSKLARRKAMVLRHQQQHPEETGEHSQNGAYPSDATSLLGACAAPLSRDNGSEHGTSGILRYTGDTPLSTDNGSQHRTSGILRYAGDTPLSTDNGSKHGTRAVLRYAGDSTRRGFGALAA